MRKLKRDTTVSSKLPCGARKNNAGKVSKIQDDIEKQKKNAEKAKEKINKKRKLKLMN